MDYGYIRVSTKDQVVNFSLENQKEALQNYGIKEENIYTEVYSGNNFTDRKIFENVVKRCVFGDRIVVVTLDRFSRSLQDGLLKIGELKKSGIILLALDLPIPNSDSDSSMSSLSYTFFTLFALMLAEFEQKRRYSRQSLGIAKAKQIPGKYPGRKSKINDKLINDFKKLNLECPNLPVETKCFQLHIKKTTYYKLKKIIKNNE
jgi:DNA invertase Pin-like site-specific DNA recombinase